MALAAALSWGCKENNKEQLTPAQQQANATAAAQDNTQIISATQEMLDVTPAHFQKKELQKAGPLRKEEKTQEDASPLFQEHLSLTHRSRTALSIRVLLP